MNRSILFHYRSLLFWQSNAPLSPASFWPVLLVFQFSGSLPLPLIVLVCALFVSARFSPDDKFSRQRVVLKKRFGLLMTQQPAKPC